MTASPKRRTQSKKFSVKNKLFLPFSPGEFPRNNDQHGVRWDTIVLVAADELFV
jgi:hypothetical protein